MNFIDLKAQQSLIRENIDKNIKKVLDHGCYINGPEISELEAKLAAYVGVNHCIGVSSGSDALLIAMMALGIGPGDEVITSPFTFIATVEMIVLLGARPVYVDIDQETYNINPSEIENAITTRTRLILSVSLFGQCSDMNKINAIAKKYGLPVIEDGAQSFGAMYNGKMSCGLSTIGCTSFFPSKPLGCYGDGGAIFTNDDNLAKFLREIRNHGQDKRYHHSLIGINGRLDTIQAAILLAKFEIFPQEVLMRNNIGNQYTKLILDRCPTIKPPSVLSGNTHIYSQYSILVEDRDKLSRELLEIGIPTAIHYPIPIHRQIAFQTSEFNLPVAENVSDRILSLPMHPYLKSANQERIVDKCSVIIND
ncbi:DegT/DnrJ/EryC1/StrS family aminotransferase [Candidatus Thioglobus autotrophicus]|uniref:DegT/DnrJ/EryC1/StrS family aminotransferase n=1 Tax=Candidatus Thioglobus autotrophicus TaxID=1705394 RepID=UPI00299E63E0|nr:DegT/DnrJ/EryC1/StrS family aminotransferase [Candidatus Thioglobus autotrophicus]WPE17729.1 DegT/DnrJ/EryC1/StrS family aminotransferase [Candidatus Thioglobus autotrophicus]